MSIISFTIKEDHLKLIPFLKFRVDGRCVMAGTEADSPFGGENFYEDMGLMLYGKVEEFDPFSEEGPTYTTEQKKYMESLFQDLPTVLEIVLRTGKFEAGTYKRKYHGLDWKLTNN